jgi:hypothetical protein
MAKPFDQRLGLIVDTDMQCNRRGQKRIGEGVLDWGRKEAAPTLGGGSLCAEEGSECLLCTVLYMVCCTVKSEVLLGRVKPSPRQLLPVAAAVSTPMGNPNEELSSCSGARDQGLCCRTTAQ